MAKTDEIQPIDVVSRYHKEPLFRGELIQLLLERFKESTEAVWYAERVSPSSQMERDSESVYALINAFEQVWKEPELDLETCFRKWLRRSIRSNLAVRKNHVDINQCSVEDPDGNPAEQYEIKEQIELLSDFIRQKYDAITLHQFQLHFIDGWSFEEIADQFSVSSRALRRKIDSVYERSQKYMRRINNE